MDARHFFSHTTAARLYGLPLPDGIESEDDLHVSVIPPFRAPKGRGIIGHQLRVDPERIILIAGLPVPFPVAVWCELAAILSRDGLVQVGDALVRRKAPLTTAERLRRAVGTASNRPSVRQMKHALTLIRARTDSPLETVLRLAILRAGLPEPQVNARIVDGTGTFVAFGDLVYRHHSVVVEFDGDQHRSDHAQYAKAVRRVRLALVRR